MIGLCFATQVQHSGFFFSVSPSSLPSALLLGLKSTEELGGRKKRQSRSRAAQSNKTISQSQAFLPSMHQFPKRLIKTLASRLMTFFFFNCSCSEQFCKVYYVFLSSWLTISSISLKQDLSLPPALINAEKSGSHRCQKSEVCKKILLAERTCQGMPPRSA